MGSDRRLLAAALAAIAFLMAGPARAAVDRPTPTAPAVGATVQFLPALAWTPVKGADKYEVQVSADAGHGLARARRRARTTSSPRNTRATLTQTVPNGTYYWRVRAIGGDGSVSPWTAPRSFKKLWTLQPTIQTPSSGASLTLPGEPGRAPLDGRRREPRSTSSRSRAIPRSARSSSTTRTRTTRTARRTSPPPRPRSPLRSRPAPTTGASCRIDAEGNRGVATPVQPFSWVWPSATTPHVHRPEHALPRSSTRSSPGTRSPAPRATRSRSTRPSTSRPARRSAAPAR